MERRALQLQSALRVQKGNSFMWSPAPSGQRLPDWSKALSLRHSLGCALPVRGRLSAASCSHCQVSRQWQVGPAQNHLHKIAEGSPLQTPPPQGQEGAQEAQEARAQRGGSPRGGARPRPRPFLNQKKKSHLLILLSPPLPAAGCLPTCNTFSPA